MDDDDHDHFLDLEVLLAGQKVDHGYLVTIQLDPLVEPSYGSLVVQKVVKFEQEEVVEGEIAPTRKGQYDLDDQDEFQSCRLLLAMQQVAQHKRHSYCGDLDRLDRKEVDELVAVDVVVEVLVHWFEQADWMAWVVARKVVRHLVYVLVGSVVYVSHLVPDGRVTYQQLDDHDPVADLQPVDFLVALLLALEVHFDFAVRASFPVDLLSQSLECVYDPLRVLERLVVKNDFFLELAHELTFRDEARLYLE